MTALTFLSPGRLWLLALVAALGAAYLVLQLKRRTYAVRFTNTALLDSVAPKRPGWRRHLPAAAMLLGLTAMVLAVARPAREERVPRERATIILAIDVSLSMQATDVEPNRLAAAKEAAKRFLEIIPPKLNVGLVSFSGSAQVLVTPTTDRVAVRRGIENLELRERTAVGEAIFACLDAIELAPEAEGDEPVPARIVLMSDGETTVGRPDEQAAAEARERDVPVSTIAFGTSEGIIRVPNDPNPVPVPVNPEAMEAIADATGGTAFEATSGDELRKVYEDIGTSVGYDTEFREILLWFVGAGLVCFFLSSLLSLLWFSRLP